MLISNFIPDSAALRELAWKTDSQKWRSYVKPVIILDYRSYSLVSNICSKWIDMIVYLK